MNTQLCSVIELIAKAVDGKDLTAREAEAVFSKIFMYDTQGYHLTALFAALHAKGETADELLGLCNSTKRLAIVLRPNVAQNNTTDLSGTGGSLVKTINVSTAASFIVAAAGITVAKQTAYAFTSPTGSADVFGSFGIDIFKLKKKQVESALEQVGICPYLISAMSPKIKIRSVVARKVFVENELHIRTPFHIAIFAYSPTPLKKRIYGCYDEKYMDILAELFVKLGNERTLILHGVGGIPEASNIGKTIVVEQNKRHIKRYQVSPNDFGLKTATADSIRSGGVTQNIIDFIRILYGQETGPKRGIVLANASASLYVMGKVADLAAGVELAREVLKEGLAFKKLEALTKRVGDMKLLEKWKQKAGIKSMP